MMNVLALSLVLTTLATAGVLSPPPEKKQDDVIVKDGHRVVVVEYEKDHRNTKVSISPHESSENIPTEKGEKMEDRSYFHWTTTPGELVCDAFGKCKRKIAGAFERTKDTAPEKAYEAAEGARGAAGDGLEKVRDTVVDTGRKAAEGARGAARDGLGKVRDTVVDTGRKAAEAAGKAYEVEERARGAARDGLGKVRDTVVDKGRKAAEAAYEVEEGARGAVNEGIGKVRDTVADKSRKAAETAKETAKDIKTDASRKIDYMKEELSDKAKQAKSKVGEAKDSAKHNILLSANRAFGMANLIGLAIAYGMCIWVTFISSYVLARALPRQQFAIVQSKIYPVYFKAMAYSIGTAFLGHLLSPRQKLHSKFVEQFLGFNLFSSLVMVLVNLFYLEPRATQVMFERMKMEKEEGRGKGSIQTEQGDQVRTTDASSDHPTGAVDGGTATATKIVGKKQQERAEEGGNGGTTTTTAESEMMRLSRKLKKLNSYSSFLNVVTLMSLTLYLADHGQRLHVAC